MITTFLVIVMLNGMPHVFREHREAVSCRTEAAELNKRARPQQRFVCVAWTRYPT